MSGTRRTMGTTGASRRSLPRKTASLPSVGPGPGSYKMPSGIGPQADSRMVSPSKAILGTGPARDTIKSSGDTPGPGAYKEPQFGESVTSTRPRSPNFSMRGREVFGAIDGDLLKMNTPGPGAYGRPKKPSERKFPEYSLGTRTWRTKRRSSTPGPGRYKGPSSFGKQKVSTIKSNNEFSFQQSKRPDLAGRPATSIGPGEYGGGVGGTGKQVESKRRTEPAFGFGTSTRFSKLTQDRRLRAGPGSYQLPGAIGKSPVSTFRSAPAPSIAGRHRFGSPYG
uniref:Uncharacterized protein n=1 Tax=Bicosoecida sp. CB-2014 TaxID=1486930 RepID=A0A7S1C3H0_9STRA|mmetsp:Transcript_10757/g.37477  ORF Transcript_10757/g.37477 Transcript_10757/m.37477 type:complete len:280 (+) Transcript_10757:201-1040(+)